MLCVDRQLPTMPERDSSAPGASEENRDSELSCSRRRIPPRVGVPTPLVDVSRQPSCLECAHNYHEMARSSDFWSMRLPKQCSPHGSNGVLGQRLSGLTLRQASACAFGLECLRMGSPGTLTCFAVCCVFDSPPTWRAFHLGRWIPAPVGVTIAILRLVRRRAARA